MSETRRRWLRRALVVAALSVTGTAVGLPWTVDMADSQGHKAYETAMVPLPEGTVAQDNILTPNAHHPNYDRMTPEGQALTAPFPASEDVLVTGEKMFETYCWPCHGDGVNLGPVGQPGRYPGVVALSGDAGILKVRTDGWVYLTIRNGGAIMPAYGWAMTDDEIWSLVHYTRTLDGAAYTPPAPAEEETE